MHSSWSFVLIPCGGAGAVAAAEGAPSSPRSPGRGTADPKSPRRRRTAKIGRIDYATMEALADLNYAMNRGTLGHFL